MKVQMPKVALKVAGAVVVLVLAGVAWHFQATWFPAAKQWAASTVTANKKEGSDGDHDGHAGHDHGGHSHAGHEESTSLKLSEQARRNVGLTAENVREIQLATFTRTISVPAMVAERPGRTRVKVVAPMTGVVTAVYVVAGEAVPQGSRMFKIRLMHEDLVQAQAAFLQTLGELDVQKQEIIRLDEITNRGIVAGKLLLAPKYAKQKLEAVLNAQRESLILHGLSQDQIAHIVEERHLVREVEVFAPTLNAESGEVRITRPPVRTVSLTSVKEVSASSGHNSRPLIVQELTVSKGEFVQAGNTLCVLADYRELFLEGRAFEHDADELAKATVNKRSITAVIEGNNKKRKSIEGLKIVYLDNRIKANSRAFFFYVGLPNQIVQDKTTSAGRRFLTWRFKPGQRMQVRIPVEQWPDRIVLPVDAVAQDGAEFFVFQENGDHFDRRPVHVEYQDQYSMVIANDGSLFPGDTVAFAGAHQLQMALKNKAGGGVDPHAGHHH